MAPRVILRPGDVFAGYTVEQWLGGGGMGNVYRARDPDLPRSVALKLLHRDLTANDYIRARFELEAAHAARLEHPNIVTVYRRGREDDQLWIAMQFIDTTDAAAAVDSGPLDPAHAVHIIEETAKALDYAHGAGVLHRDVKPANILLERSRPERAGRVLLAETVQLTQTGMLVASLQYASPEQFDNVELDARADEYSLGCTLFHLLTGEIPYPGTTLPQLWAGHVHSPIPKPCRVRPGLPPGFDAVIERAIAKDRRDRYPSCGELAAAARAALHAPQPRVQPAVHNPERSAPTVPDSVPPRPIPRPDEPPSYDAVTPFAPPRPGLDTATRRPTEPSRSPQLLARPKQAGGADWVFRGLALAGLVLLVALVGAALFTWQRHFPWRYYSDYTMYQPVVFPIDATGYTYATAALGVFVAVGSC